VRDTCPSSCVGLKLICGCTQSVGYRQYSQLDGKLQQLGFTPSRAETSLFFYNCGRHKVFVLIYAHDINVVSSSSEAADALVSDLGKDFALKDLGNLHYFLGIEVNMSSKSLILTQE
jgi:hypothetical protein